MKRTFLSRITHPVSAGWAHFALTTNLTRFGMLRKSLWSATFACLVLSLAACGGAGKQAVTTTPSNTHFPTGLEIAPALSLQSVGATQQFKATATFNDATTRDVTALSVWASNANSVATVTQSSGLESAVGVGDVTISATFGMAGETVTASFLVHVTATPLQSIAVGPQIGNLELGANQRFIAIGTFGDGTTHNLSELVSWSSSDKTVLRVNSTSGVANTRGPGIASISAAVNGISGSRDVTVARRVPKFLYAGGLFGIEGFAVDPATGKLTSIAGSKFTAVGEIVSLAVTRDHHFVFAADPGLGVVWGFQIGTAGELVPLTDGPFRTSATSAPISVVAHPTADFLFMTDANAREITTFSIGANGSLTALPPANLANTELLLANISPDGRFFYQALHVGSAASIPAFSIAANGTLSAIPGDPAGTGFFPRTLAVDPSGRFLYAVIPSSSLGPSTSVFGYNIDPLSGALTPITLAPFAAGENPLSAAADASGRFLYVANGANSASGNSVTGFAIDADTGILAELQGSPFPAPASPVSITVEPGAQFVYVGLDATAGARGFAIDQTTGTLTEINGSPFPTDGNALAIVATY